MKKAKPEHRRDYWKYHVAAHSFEQAADAAVRLQPLTDGDPLSLPLMVALHVLYARPFQHEKRTRRIAELLVPKELAPVHKMLIKMRDRIFAHHDKDSKITDDDTGVDLFQLVVVVQRGEIRPGVQLVYQTDFQLGKIQELCRYLYQTCMRRAEDALIKCITVTPIDGLYRVSTEFEGRAPLLVPSEWSTEQSRGHLKETKRRIPES